MGGRRFRGVDTDPGWINRKFADTARERREQRAEKRLESATISRGGLTVRDGGSIKVLYPDGSEGITAGPWYLDGAHIGSQLMMFEEDGETVAFGIQRASSSPERPAGLTIMQARAGTIQMFAVENLYLVAGDQAMISTLDGGTFLIDDTVGMLLDHPLGVFITATTTSSAANTFLDPVSGRVYRVTSSLRYKRDVADADIDVDQVLALTPRRFRRKDEVDEHGDDAPTYVGFIAEEAADLGLDDWVTSDDEGPESFAYSSWAVALQAVARRQQQQIADLTARLEQLEAN